MNDILDEIRPEDEARQAAGAIEEAIAAGLPANAGVLLTLHDLWSTAGNPATAEAHLINLATSITESNALEMATGVRGILAALPSPAPKAAQELDRLQELIRLHRRRLLLSSIPLDERRIHKFDLAREVMLAQRLFKAKTMSAQELFGVFMDICGYSQAGAVKPSTVLHAIHDQAMGCEQKVMEYLVKHAGLPFLSLACFALKPEAALALHVEFMKHRAALVFDTVGPDALVAILNPYNQKLRQDVALVTQRNCHFFLVSAGEYDKALDLAIRQSNQSVVNLVES